MPTFLILDLTETHVQFLLRWSEKRLVPGTGTLLRSKIGTTNIVSVVASVGKPPRELVGASVTVYYHDAILSSVTVVHPDWRCQGVGRQMLRMKRDELLDRGVRLESIVGVTNKASMRMTESVLRPVGIIGEGPRGPRMKFIADD